MSGRSIEKHDCIEEIQDRFFLGDGMCSFKITMSVEGENICLSLNSLIKYDKNLGICHLPGMNYKSQVGKWSIGW